MILKAVALLFCMITGSIDHAPAVYWSDDTFVGEQGTVHAEAYEGQIESGEEDCIVPVTIKDGSPAEFYNQEVEPGEFKKMGKIRFVQNGGVELWLTEDELRNIARQICFD